MFWCIPQHKVAHRNRFWTWWRWVNDSTIYFFGGTTPLTSLPLPKMKISVIAEIIGTSIGIASSGILKEQETAFEGAKTLNREQTERARDVKYVPNKRWRWHVAHQLPGHWRGTNNCRGKSNKRIESSPRAQESREWDGWRCYRPELQSAAQQCQPLRLEVILMLSDNTFPVVRRCLYNQSR